MEMRTPKNCEDRLLNKSPTRILKSQMTHRQIKQTRKQTKYPSTEEWIKKTLYIYTKEYYSDIKRMKS